MKATFSRSALLDELQLLAAVVDRKLTIPILAGVKITATSTGEVVCAATNLDLGLVSRLTSPAVARGGAAVIPLDTLVALVQRFPHGDLALDAGDTSAALSLNGTSAKLPTWAVADFPQIPTVVGDEASVPASFLLELIARVRHAMGESSYFPAGAHFSIGDGAIRLAATDSYRIATAAQALQSPTSFIFSLRDRAWEALSRILKEMPDATVTITKGENTVSFAASSRTFLAQLIDRKYPSYERVIPTEMAFTAIVAAEPLCDVLRRHVVLASQERTEVTCTLADGQLSFATQTAKGSAADTLAVESPAVGSFVFALNPKFALDTLDGLQAERVALSISADDRASIWRDAAKPDAMTAAVSLMKV